MTEWHRDSRPTIYTQTCIINTNVSAIVAWTMNTVQRHVCPCQSQQRTWVSLIVAAMERVFWLSSGSYTADQRLPATATNQPPAVTNNKLLGKQIVYRCTQETHSMPKLNAEHYLLNQQLCTLYDSQCISMQSFADKSHVVHKVWH